MRILYDGYIYNKQAFGGTNRYFNNLICRLPNKYSPILAISGSLSNNFPVHPNIKIIGYKKRRFPFNNIPLWFEKYYFDIVINFHKPDIIHPTYYFSVRRKDVGNYRSPIILTVYDMVHEIVLKTSNTSLFSLIKKNAILSADRIICISENTKKDLIEQYSLPEKLITVTHLASEIDESVSYGSEKVPSHPYYLYVGSRARYKNFNGLLLAFSKIISYDRDIELCVVGLPFEVAEKRFIGELKLENNVKNYGNVNDRHLAKLYRCSIALVYPSFYEGFGIPLLEAMSCGTVVVASNCSSIPEVVGDAGILFNPRSVDDLTDILGSLPNDSSERKRFIKKGYNQAKLFSWEKTTKKTVDVYRSVI